MLHIFTLQLLPMEIALSILPIQPEFMRFTKSIWMEILRQLTHGLGTLTSPEISPDGNLIAFTLGDGQTPSLWVMNRDGSSAQGGLWTGMGSNLVTGWRTNSSSPPTINTIPYSCLPSISMARISNRSRKWKTYEDDRIGRRMEIGR